MDNLENMQNITGYFQSLEMLKYIDIDNYRKFVFATQVLDSDGMKFQKFIQNLDCADNKKREIKICESKFFRKHSFYCVDIRLTDTNEIRITTHEKNFIFKEEINTFTLSQIEIQNLQSENLEPTKHSQRFFSVCTHNRKIAYYCDILEGDMELRSYDYLDSTQNKVAILPINTFTKSYNYSNNINISER